MAEQAFRLEKRTTPGARVESLGSSWRLSIPAGQDKTYRWSQLDDYLHRQRSQFAWQAPCRLSLRARISSPNLPGTWGFGWWNDPFNLSMGLSGTTRRFPALPNCAWFFYASPPNYLSLVDNLPADGFLAATFRSPLLPSLLLTPGVILLPLLGWPWAARHLRRGLHRLIQQDTRQVAADYASWHTYVIEWRKSQVVFQVDSQVVLNTSVSPAGKLGMVLWIDNQYAAFTPQGSLHVGVLPNAEPGWLEIDQLSVTN